MKNKQPNSANCFACGMENQFGLKLEFYSNDASSVQADYVVAKQFEGFPGVVHGGIIASILDELCVRPFMANDHNRFMFTAKLTTKFRSPIPINTQLKLVGKIIKDKGRTAESEAYIYNEDGDILAQASALVVEFQEDQHSQTIEDRLGWKVYPDKESK